jgi:hypothetical protein
VETDPAGLGRRRGRDQPPNVYNKCLTKRDAKLGMPSRGGEGEIETTDDEVSAPQTSSALPAGASPAKRLHAAPGAGSS